MYALADFQPPGLRAEPLLAAVPSHQERVDAGVRRLAARPDLPAFPSSVQGLVAAAKLDTSSFAGLTRFIAQDLGLTVKLLRVVNSARYSYRLAASPISSVARAVSMLGIDSVVEYALGATAAGPALEGLMLGSLLTAHHAKQVALRIQLARIEDAFLCGMLRNLGEVLVAWHLPQEYAAIQQDMKESATDARTACFRVLEFSYEDLGKGMARHWNLPERAGQCMERSERFQCRSESGVDRLRMVTNFSHGLTEAVYRRDPARAKPQIRLLLDRFGDALGLKEKHAHAILELAAAEAQSAVEASGVPIDRLRLPAAGGSAQEADYELNRETLGILEAVRETAKADRVILGVLNRERTAINARLGVGQNIDALVAVFRLSLSLRNDPVAKAILALEEQNLDRGADRRFLQSRFAVSTGAKSVCLLPLVVDKTLAGCLYLDKRSAPLDLAPAAMERLRKLRNQAANAFARQTFTRSAAAAI